MKEYGLNKNAFKMQSFAESDLQNVFEHSVPFAERLKEAYYLISIAYGFSIDNPPKMDRTIFSSRKLNNQNEHL